MKKAITFIVGLFLLGQCTYAYDFSAVAPTGQTLYYSIINGSEVKVISQYSGGGYSGNTKPTGILSIPTTVTNGSNTYQVTSIGNDAFDNCSGLTSVTIPNSVTSIGDYAFCGCSGLTSVTIPNSVTSIGNYAFYNCSGLTAIVVEAGNTHYDSRNNCNAIIQTDLNLLIQGCNSTVIPNSVTSIGDYAFYNCSGLSIVTIGNLVTSIGQCAFYGCSGLASVTIPNSVTSIGNSAFRNCSGLTSVTIPNMVTSIGNSTFEDCSGLTSVTIGNSVTSIGDYAFEKCSGLTSVTIPNSVTSIGNNAFKDCSGLTSVTIGNSVTSIGNNAFYNCCLASVYCKPTTPPMLGNQYLFSTFQIYVPCNSVSAYQSATNWSNYSSRIYGKPFDMGFTYTFLSSDDSMGTVNYGSLDCDSNIIVNAAANTGYRFLGWSDGGTGNPRTFHLTGNTTVMALFDYITYAVVGQSSETARGIVEGSDTVYYGDTVLLAAMPNYGYHFTRWNDFNTENPRTITATTNVAYTAYFDPNTYSVTLLSDNTDQGSVSSSGITTYLGNRTIYATPATGYHFSHWSDGDSNATRTITVTQDTVLTAFFEINNYILTVLPNVETLGTVTGSGTYTHGTQVSVTATPAQGNRFDRWSDYNMLASRTVTMTSNLQLVAVFVPVDTVHVHDTTIIHDTTFVDVLYAVHDTTYINVPYPVHDTTIVHDTAYVNVYVPVHDTTILTDFDTIYLPVYVHDTSYVNVHDTTYLPVYLHDTTYVDVFVHDTTIVHDTAYVDVFVPVHDTTYVNIHDTTYINVPYPVHDTTIVHDTAYVDVFVPVHDTTYVNIHDTTYINVPYPVHDTTIVVDTLTVTQFDTIVNTVYDTIDNYIYDTLTVTDTLWLTQYDTIWMHDTIVVHDTIYITQEGIGDVEALNAKVYSSQGQIVVEGAEGNRVTLFDVNGRVLATKQDDYTSLHFDAPISGTYMIKIGNLPARKVVVIR